MNIHINTEDAYEHKEEKEMKEAEETLLLLTRCYVVGRNRIPSRKSEKIAWNRQ